MNITILPKKEEMDPVGAMFKRVRDATVCKEGVTMAEKIAVLDAVKHELLCEFQRLVHGDHE